MTLIITDTGPAVPPFTTSADAHVARYTAASIYADAIRTATRLAPTITFEGTVGVVRAGDDWEIVVTTPGLRMITINTHHASGSNTETTVTVTTDGHTSDTAGHVAGDLGPVLRWVATRDIVTLTETATETVELEIRYSPAHRAGHPTIAGTRITPADVAGRVAAGEPLREVAADYALTDQQARLACWYVTRYPTGGSRYWERAASRAWEKWAEQWIEASFWRKNPDALTDPPTVPGTPR